MQRLILGGARPMRFGSDVEVYGRGRRSRYGDDVAFSEEVLARAYDGRDPDQRRVSTVVRGRMSADERAFAEEVALAREAGFVVEEPRRYGDGRDQWLSLGEEIIVPALGDVEVSFLANFTFKLTGVRVGSSEGTGILLKDLQIDRKSQLLRKGGINCELLSEVATGMFTGDTANRGCEITAIFKNWTAGELSLHGPVLTTALAR